MNKLLHWLKRKLIKPEFIICKNCKTYKNSNNKMKCIMCIEGNEYENM